MSTHSKVIAQTDRHAHTHTHDENITSTAYAGGKNLKQENLEPVCCLSRYFML